MPQVSAPQSLLLLLVPPLLALLVVLVRLDVALLLLELDDWLLPLAVEPSDVEPWLVEPLLWFPLEPELQPSAASVKEKARSLRMVSVYRPRAREAMAGVAVLTVDAVGVVGAVAGGGAVGAAVGLCP